MGAKCRAGKVIKERLRGDDLIIEVLSKDINELPLQ